MIVGLSALAVSEFIYGKVVQRETRNTYPAVGAGVRYRAYA